MLSALQYCSYDQEGRQEIHGTKYIYFKSLHIPSILRSMKASPLTPIQNSGTDTEFI